MAPSQSGPGGPADSDAGKQASAVQRRRSLRAVFAADIAGFSGRMSLNETNTVNALSEIRLVGRRVLEKHNGWLFGMPGDGLFATFESAVSAVQCALDMQLDLATRPHLKETPLRIGIHLGEVIIDDDLPYGETLNIAARLESLADPGGILVSGTVMDAVSARVSATFEDRGVPILKNIPRRIPTFAVKQPPARSPTDQTQHGLSNLDRTTRLDRNALRKILDAHGDSGSAAGTGPGAPASPSVVAPSTPIAESANPAPQAPVAPLNPPAPTPVLPAGANTEPDASVLASPVPPVAAAASQEPQAPSQPTPDPQDNGPLTPVGEPSAPSTVTPDVSDENRPVDIHTRPNPSGATETARSAETSGATQTAKQQNSQASGPVEPAAEVKPRPRTLTEKLAQLPTPPAVTSASAAQSGLPTKPFTPATAEPQLEKTLPDVSPLPQVAAQGASTRPSIAFLEELTKALAVHVGPFSKLIVDREMKTGPSIFELISKLEDHIPNDDERLVFRVRASHINSSLFGSGDDQS